MEKKLLLELKNYDNMLGRLYFIVILSLSVLQSNAQLKHLVIIDPSGLDGELKSINAVVDTCNGLVNELELLKEEFLLFVCNGENPVFFRSGDNFKVELDKILLMDPDKPTPLSTIRYIVQAMKNDDFLADGFVIHYLSSLSNLLSHSTNHKEYILGGVVGVLKDEIEKVQIELYISNRDREINPEYFQDLLLVDSFNVHIYQ